MRLVHEMQFLLQQSMEVGQQQWLLLVKVFLGLNTFGGGGGGESDVDSM